MTFDIQVDRSGWSEVSGSKFTMNFEALLPSGKYRARFGDLLRRRPSPEELAMVSRASGNVPAFQDAERESFGLLARRVIAKLPASGEPRHVDTSLDHATDPWMRYADLADVAQWFEAFIVPRLTRMLDALALGPPTPMATPELTAPSLSLGVVGERVHLRLSAADGRRLGVALRKPWKTVTLRGPTQTLVLEQGGAVRGPVGTVDCSSGKLRWVLGRSTRAVLVEMLEEPSPGSARPVEDRAGAARFDTRVTLVLDVEERT